MCPDETSKQLISEVAEPAPAGPFRTEVKDAPHANLFCHRCGAHLAPGRGDFYVVRVEAFADPTPPSFSEDDLLCDPGEEIDRLIEQMSEMSQQEMMDQVCRRFTLHLCGPCYRRWIENPTP